MNRPFISWVYPNMQAESERKGGGGCLSEEGKKKKRNPVFTLSVSERIIKVARSRGRQTELV